MNRAVVIRAAAGLVAYLQAGGSRGGSTDTGGATATGTAPGAPATGSPSPIPAPTVVVGFDARHNSDVFARDTCAVVVAAGGRALLLPRPLPTPLLAFAIRHLGADAGVMVTASHNPPRDNGYKVYLGDGSQIVPPADTEIAARIDAVPSVADVARAEPPGPGSPTPPDRWVALGEEVVEAYLDAVVSVVDPATPRELPSSTPRCTASAVTSSFARSSGPASPARSSSTSRRRPIPTSRPCPSRTPRSPARSTSPSPSPGGCTPTSSSPPTPTPTAAPSQSATPARPLPQTPRAGGCSAATRWASSSAST